MKKKKQKLFAIGIIVVILLALFIYFNYYKSQTIGDIPSGCGVLSFGETSGQFTCPSEQCDVNGYDTCISQTGAVAKVIFRTNAVSDSFVLGTWIALNCVPSGQNCIAGSLNGYCYSSSTTSSSGTRILTTSGGTDIYVYNGNIYVGNRKFSPCTTADTTETAKEPFASNNQEIYKDYVNKYYCSNEWKVYNNSLIRSSGIITYSNSISGSYETGVKRINKNEIFMFPGSIKYSLIDTSNICIIDKCSEDKKSIVKCESSGFSCSRYSGTEACPTGTTCVDKSSGAVCESPFTTSMIIKDGFSTGEQINFGYSINSNNNKYVSLTFKLVNKANSASILQTYTTQTNVPNTINHVFNGISSVGTYQIIVEKSYDGISLPVENYEFRIGSPLTIVMKIPYSQTTGTNLITNSPFIVDIEATESGIPTTELVNMAVKAYIKKSDGSTLQVTVPNKEIVNNVFRYTFNIGIPGLFSIEAQAQKFGVLSNIQSRETEIREPKIDISFSNLLLIQNSNPGLLKVKFETKDNENNYINTNNNVKIIPSGASTGSGDIDVSNIVKNTNTGKYEFDYSFVRGSYIIEVKSSLVEYNIVSTLKSPTINIDDKNTPAECQSSIDCSTGKICVDRKCVVKDQPILLYVIIGALVIIIVTAVYFIFKISKKKQINIPADNSP